MKILHRNAKVFAAVAAASLLILLAGCDTAALSLGAIDFSQYANDVTEFMRQFSREALSAFLL